jgi:hypothetical protein
VPVDLLGPALGVGERSDAALEEDGHALALLKECLDLGFDFLATNSFRLRCDARAA